MISRDTDRLKICANTSSNLRLRALRGSSMRSGQEQERDERGQGDTVPTEHSKGVSPNIAQEPFHGDKGNLRRDDRAEQDHVPVFGGSARWRVMEGFEN